MKHSVSDFSLRRGFTLIELLIVIGVLGILATGLLAAVDPFEQLRKGRDTSVRNTVIEFHNALIRYYATHGDLPWNDSGGCGGTWSGDITSSGSETVETLDGAGCVDDLINDGELKEDFIVGLGNNADKILITSDSAVSVAVCFVPESRSVYNEDVTRFDDNGDVDNSNCGPGATKDVNDQVCHWCAK